jgi:hypothetical protein
VRGGDRVGTAVDGDGDVADAVGARDAGGRIRKLAQRGVLGVTEPIASTHAHHCPFGADHAQQLRRHRLSAPVVPDFEHVDIAERPIGRKWL